MIESLIHWSLNVSQITDTLSIIASEVGECLNAVSPASLDKAVKRLAEPGRVFVAGMGRSARGPRETPMRTPDMHGDCWMR